MQNASYTAIAAPQVAAAQPLRRTLLPPPPCRVPPLAAQLLPRTLRGAHGAPCHICLAAQQPAAFHRPQGSQAAGSDRRSTWQQIRQRLRSWDRWQVATAVLLLVYFAVLFRVCFFFGQFGVFLWALYVAHVLLSWQQSAAFDQPQGSQAAGSDRRSTWEQIRQRLRSWDRWQVATAVLLLVYFTALFWVSLFFGQFGVFLWALYVAHVLVSWHSR